MVIALAVLLRAACPRAMRVLAAPFGVRQDESNEVQPDVLVARYADLADRCLPVAPPLAVEVISPYSRLRDRELKKAFYERWGVPRYWLVDPDRTAPSLTVHARTDAGTFERRAQIEGTDGYDADEPFPVRGVPDELVAGLRP
ncbi:MAG: Uma2 family endonuclease [Streptosporangiales bacterium]|nr:Uma2 family endonuclease [Streptosporangiales bacterium]MBO0889510.1 Uma2 family endonuclease [Acidothermales bacterium]